MLYFVGLVTSKCIDNLLDLLDPLVWGGVEIYKTGIDTIQYSTAPGPNGFIAAKCCEKLVCGSVQSMLASGKKITCASNLRSPR